jgi:regulator of sigma E protease
MDILGSIGGGAASLLFGYIVPFLVVLTIVVFVHEMGHFLVGRWCGVGVTAFSVGFGPEIAGFTDRRGTRWKLSTIPLGGYVKFVGDVNTASVPDQDALQRMSPAERSVSFPHKTVAQRAAVVAAGAESPTSCSPSWFSRRSSTPTAATSSRRAWTRCRPGRPRSAPASRPRT